MGSLSRAYLHSAITESLWYAVTEAEHMFQAKLSHAVMLASLYGNPLAKLDSGNEQVHEMYVGALGTAPYLAALTKRAAHGDKDALVEEWRRANAELAARKAAGEEGGDVAG